LRQRPDRYAFRAGRNLPDKEFRYLRTVIVTAAVYRGFPSSRQALRLTFRHWAGISPYTSAFAFAETCVFGKQSPGPVLCGPLTLGTAWIPHATGAPLLPKLRGQFAEFLNEGSPVHLGMLYLSTCVGVRYGHQQSSLEAFRGRTAQFTWYRCRYLTITPRVCSSADLPAEPPYTLGRWLPIAEPTARRHPFTDNGLLWYWNVDQLSIAYDLRPRLRPD
jgi:hypothetical protein